MNFSKETLLLYAVTDRKTSDMDLFLSQVEAALKGGVTLLQLREKNLDDESFINEAITVKALCEKYGVPLIINDNIAVALKSGADGVHVGIEDTPVEKIREIAGDDFIIGATAKTTQQAVNAEKAGATYLGVGAVFPSPTKKNAIRITNEQLREICSSVKIPAVAIGGINLENADEISGSGISGIAVVSSVFSADDIQSAAEKLKAKAKEIVK